MAEIALSQCNLVLDVSSTTPEAMLMGLDSFTVSLHSPNGRLLPAVWAVQGGCQWPVKNGENSHPSHEQRILCDWGIPQPIFRPANQERAMPDSWRPCFISTDGPAATRLGLCSSLHGLRLGGHSQCLALQCCSCMYPTNIWFNAKET